LTAATEAGKLILPVDEARELLWGGDHDQFEVEADLYLESRRWVSGHELVIKNKTDGTMWMSYYERGLTENQYTEPWEDEQFAKFDKVEKVAVTTYEYKLA
jgi:hypothetical protein